MNKQQNQGQNKDRAYKIYLSESRQFVEVSKEVYECFYRPVWRIQKTAQKIGQCMCPREKLWQCDGDCLVCKHRAAGMGVSLNYCYENKEGEEYTPMDLLVDVMSEDMETKVTDKMLYRQIIDRLYEICPEARRIAELRLEGYSFQQTADKLGVPRKTMSYWLQKARAQLREEFGEDCREVL